jgi:hypothetical protein
MKTVKNPNFADRDLNVSGTNYTGDAEGIFEMADEHADKVLGMKGWGESAKAPTAPADFDPVKSLREEVDAAAPAPPAPGLAPAPTIQPPAPDAPESPPESPAAPPEAADAQPPAETESGGEAPASEDGEGESDDGEGDGPDLEAATTKKALYEIAKEWDVKLTAEQKKGSVEDIRAILDAEIYGGEDGD